MENTNTIPRLLDFFVNKYKNKLLFQRRDGWSWKQLTWLDFDAEIKNLAAFLLSLDFKSGNDAVIISSNKIECVFCELAIYYLGGSVIPFRDPESFSKNSDSVSSINPEFLFIEDIKYLDKLRKDKSLFDNFRKVIVFNYAEIGRDEKVIPYKGLVKFGQLRKKELLDVLKSNSRSVDSKQTALKLFSDNGNSLLSESVMDHEKILQLLRSSQKKLAFITEEDQSYSYLVGSSLFEKLINILGLVLGMRIIIAEDVDSFYKDILEAKPTVLFESGNRLKTIYNSFILNERTNDLRGFLGGRLKYLVTEFLPDKNIEDSFRKSGIEIIELTELRDIS